MHGPSWLKQKTLLNGTSTVSTYKLLYNGVAQITSALYRNSGDTATIIGYEHGYDKVANPQYEIRTHQSSEGDAYIYDNLYRVTRTIYDDADPTSPTYASARTDDWLLDDIGNRTRIYAKSATPTEYEHNAVNEYTSVGGTGYEYDAVGNLTKDDTHYYFWDYENLLTKVELVDGGADVAAYTYDANNRRVEKLDYTADPDETTQYFYNGWSCIEEREGDGTLIATYINGPRIDEYILMNRNSTDYWYMQSPIVGNVAALVNSSGTIQEGYKYRAYGQATVLADAGNDSTWFTSDDDTASVSSIGNPYTFTGRRLDHETILMYYRNRMYQPETGSFISRDPIGYVDGMSLYLGYFAPDKADPLGQEKKCCFNVEYDDTKQCCQVYGSKLNCNPEVVKVNVYTMVNGRCCNRSEKSEVFWAVGPWDGRAAKKCADEAAAEATVQNTGLNDGANGQGPLNAFKHCYWSCRMAQEIGVAQAEEVGDIHECRNMKNKEQTEKDLEMDLHNNAYGRYVVSSAPNPTEVDCRGECLAVAGMKKYSPLMMDTSAP